MVEDIYRIYYNEFGIAFQWKQHVNRRHFNKIQLVFRDMGFHLSSEEIKLFLKQVKAARQHQTCNCEQEKQLDCKNILLKTPSQYIDLAVSKKELNLIADLLKGTLFNLELNGYLNTVLKI